MPATLKASFKELAALTDCDPSQIVFAAYLKLFQKCLTDHDYLYDFSEDHQVWIVGKTEEETIKASIKKYPGLNEIWKAYIVEQAQKTGATK